MTLRVHQTPTCRHLISPTLQDSKVPLFTPHLLLNLPPDMHLSQATAAHSATCISTITEKSHSHPHSHLSVLHLTTNSIPHQAIPFFHLTPDHATPEAACASLMKKTRRLPPQVITPAPKLQRPHHRQMKPQEQDGARQAEAQDDAAGKKQEQDGARQAEDEAASKNPPPRFKQVADPPPTQVASQTQD